MKRQKTKVFSRLQEAKEWNTIGVNIAQQQHSRDVLKKRLSYKFSGIIVGDKLFFLYLEYSFVNKDRNLKKNLVPNLETIASQAPSFVNLLQPGDAFLIWCFQGV